jgi:hypothetical protein
MTIVGHTGGYETIVGYLNTDYSSLSIASGARELNVYSSIFSDIGSLQSTSGQIVFVQWVVVFAFDIMPGDKSTSFHPLPTAKLGQATTARFGQATGDFYLNYQCFKTSPYSYTLGIGQSTYPRGRYNLSNLGTANFVGSKDEFSGFNSLSADSMYLWSPYVDAGALTLQLQIQYFSKIAATYSSYYILDV